MRVDALAIELRPRAMLEAADLGVRLVQTHARSIMRCWLPVVAAVAALAIAAVEFGSWAPWLILLWCKPWLDRTVLFVLSRAAFGQDTRWADLWAQQRRVWWAGAWRSFTIDRLSPWRAFTAPVTQLEGASGAARSARIAQFARGKRGAASLALAAFWHVEGALSLGAMSLVFWFAPPESSSSLWSWFTSDESLSTALVTAAIYAVTVAVVEPFYVASGFAMYLNRRVELEAWDIEQELRRSMHA